MHEYMTTRCEEHCNKFSHCNNNDLICVSKYRAKERECESLREQLDDLQENCPYFNSCSYRQCDKHRIKNYQQMLDEILQTLKDASYNVISEIPQSQMELTQYTLSVCQAKLCKILDIINKTKGK